MVCLDWVLWLEGRPPVVQDACPVYDDKTFNVVKGVLCHN
uniref:Cko2 n=1 Tax=Arundo donax TaxID=35708 RepID=A0A0A9B431_ARUDO